MDLVLELPHGHRDRGQHGDHPGPEKIKKYLADMVRGGLRDPPSLWVHIFPTGRKGGTL